jgi:preprotein translocase subunit SecE
VCIGRGRFCGIEKRNPGASAPGVKTGGVNTGMTSKINPAQFMRQVRQEVAKVTWPTRKETGVTTGLVFVMVFVAAIFFFLVDQVLSFLVRQTLLLGG